MRIRTLLVDDSPETLEVLSLLYSANPEIEVIGTVKTASEAMAFLESTSTDLVSLDIHLGSDNGLQLCAQIHRHHPHVFIAMCSLEDDESYWHVAQQIGAGHYLTKPITVDDIEDLVQRLRKFRSVDWERTDVGQIDCNDSEWVVRILATP